MRRRLFGATGIGYKVMTKLASTGWTTAAALALAAAPVAGAAPKAPPTPENILPPMVTTPTSSPAPPAVPAALPTATPSASPTPVVAPTPVTVPEPVVPWTLTDARALLSVIAQIDAEGLIPGDYQPEALRAAIAAGEGPALDAVASKSFNWLAEDLRDGRTPMTSRLQWFAVDPDVDTNPTLALLSKATTTHDVAGVLASLAPTYPDYQVLKSALATTPKADSRTRALLRANMDRWRWLPRDLGLLYLIANVPEFQLRLRTNQRVVRTYKTIVGKPGKTATPQLAEAVQAVVFNPTWTVPQSIVVGEGLGAKLLARPDKRYKVTKAADGFVTVVQQPGPTNSLGLMKIDMPNPHAIYLHDTPNRNLFNATMRAMSHGCLRTERAQELGMTMAMLGADLTPELAVEYATSGKYTKVPMTKTFPVYISYFTMGSDIGGNLTTFGDIYERDAPVLASFAAPRQLKTSQRKSDEKVIKLDNPL
jgi:L,D-transpeptidase YcbB